MPTPIQTQAIPVALAGQDLIGIAQTGTGKTLAFGVPILQKLFREQQKVSLVILPTRELALQVDEFFKKLGASCQLKTAVLIGGANIRQQMIHLRRRPNIIIATPGRLIDHLGQKTVHLNDVGILVLDEADRMLDMGFAPQIKQILTSVPKDRQTMLFSATMPDGIVKIANDYMRLPVRVEVAPAGSATANVTHEIFFVHKPNKLDLLAEILNQYKGTVLIFSRTKFGAKKIAAAIRNMHHTAVEIHSDRSLNQRLAALRGFKKGEYRILVATDIAARGLDVSNIELVVNFDLPEQLEDYVHRIGRTGRAEATGHAISFATPEQRSDVKSIERLIKQELPVSPLPAHLPQVVMTQAVRQPSHGRNRQPNRPGKFNKPNNFGPKKFKSFSDKPSFPGQRRDHKQFGQTNARPAHQARPGQFKNKFSPKKDYQGSQEPKLFADDLGNYLPSREAKPRHGRPGGQRPFNRRGAKNFRNKKRAY